jgi:Uma2 family endonuclease
MATKGNQILSTLTLDQFLGLAETKPASEYACGEVLQKPMPDVPHAAIQFFLGAVLYPFLAQTGLGRGFTELRCVFGPPGRERTYVPDLVFVSRQHLPITQRHLHRAPDLAVEILSPDQHWAQFLDKIQFYLLHGVRLVWVIDPATSTVTVQVPGEDARILRPGDHLDGGDVLPGFSLPIAEMFAQMDTL